MSEPLRITPGMIQPRGEFPKHSDPLDHAGGPLTRQAALTLALRRLAQWQREHHARQEAEQYGD